MLSAVVVWIQTYGDRDLEVKGLDEPKHEGCGNLDSSFLLDELTTRSEGGRL